MKAHHHHTLDGEIVHHSHPEAFHDKHGQHPDEPEWSPAHYGHDHMHSSLLKRMGMYGHVGGKTPQTVGTPQKWSQTGTHTPFSMMFHG